MKKAFMSCSQGCMTNTKTCSSLWQSSKLSRKCCTSSAQSSAAACVIIESDNVVVCKLFHRSKKNKKSVLREQFAFHNIRTQAK